LEAQTMGQKYEYQFHKTSAVEDIQHQLDMAGANGFRLVHFSPGDKSTVFVMERTVTESDSGD
jgi:hypothetical protein